MRLLVIGLVLGALLLVPLTPAHAIVCNNSTVLGTYIFTFSGVDAEGNTLSDLRGLRKDFKSLGPVSTEMERMIYGYDLLVLVPSPTPSKEIQ